jgi:dTDP-4-dehydrorhamnose 3,5-epimerase
MKIFKSSLNKVLIIKNKPFHDFRGKYLEIYNKDLLLKKKIKLNFIQDDISISKKNVLRGIHGDDKTWKLVSCLYGKIKLLVINNNNKSKQYKKYSIFLLSDKNNIQILIPPKFGNAHYVLSKYAIFHYKQTTNYDRRSQFSIKWNDPAYNINWKIKSKPILSKRDG